MLHIFMVSRSDNKLASGLLAIGDFGGKFAIILCVNGGQQKNGMVCILVYITHHYGQFDIGFFMVIDLFLQKYGMLMAGGLKYFLYWYW